MRLRNRPSRSRAFDPGLGGYTTVIVITLRLSEHPTGKGSNRGSFALPLVSAVNYHIFVLNDR